MEDMNGYYRLAHIPKRLLRAGFPNLSIIAYHEQCDAMECPLTQDHHRYVGIYIAHNNDFASTLRSHIENRAYASVEIRGEVHVLHGPLRLHFGHFDGIGPCPT